MYWREASAAMEAGVLAEWFDLPLWHRAWIIATVENKNELSGALYG